MFAGQTFHHLSPSPTSWALSILFGHLQAGLESPEESEEAVAAQGDVDVLHLGQGVCFST